MFQVNQKTGVTIDKTVNEVAWDMCRFSSLKQDHLRMNVAPNQTSILGLQIFLNHRSLSSINQKILMTPQLVHGGLGTITTSSATQPSISFTH